MKLFKQLLSLTICVTLVSGHSQNAFAENSETRPSTNNDAKYSDHAYNPNGFCSVDGGAEKWMTKLQKINAEKFEKIEMYKKEIADLVESDKLVSSTREIKNRYMNSINEISNDQNDVINNVGFAKSLKNDGMSLNAVSSKSSKIKNNIVGSISSFFQQRNNLLPEELAQSTQNRVDQIVESIPQEFSPEQMDTILNSKSPAINKLLENNVTKEDLTACLGENTNAEIFCNKIGINPSDRVNAKKILEVEFESLSKQFQSNPIFTPSAFIPGLGVLTPEVREMRTKILNKKFTTVQDIKAAMNQNVKRLSQFSFAESSATVSDDPDTTSPAEKSNYDKAKEQIAITEKKLTGTEIFFYEPPADMEQRLKVYASDINTKEGAMAAVQIQESAYEYAVSNAAYFDKECNFERKTATSVTSDQINICFDRAKGIIPKIDNLKDSHIDKISALNSRVQRLVSDPNFADVETLKKYVAEKYLCSCNKKDKKTLSIDKEKESLIFNGESCSTEFLTLSKIDGLNDVSSVIANTLYAHEINLPMDDESCAMNPDKLMPFTNTCKSNNFIKDNFTDICTSITSEYVAKTQNEEIINNKNKKWEKFNNEHYVEYNSKSPNGYSAVKKKSNWRVIGDGVLPIIPNALPMWLGNFQMKSNINLLTSQGIMQKQYLHNVGVYNQSPWLYNYNYFGYGNPFSAGSTTLPGTTGLGGSSGFNFGQ